MPEGQRSWATSKGPRTLVTLRLPASVCLLLNLAGADVGMSRTAFATKLIERWADEWLSRHREELDEAVTAEQERRSNG
jgi:hypothetical protein